MRSKIVPVKNVMALAAAGEALIKRAPGMPGMGLVHGETGYGKTTAITWYFNRCNGVYVRAMACWTPAAMLGAILKGLGSSPRGSCAQMMQDIIEKLALSNRPLFVDEADYLVDSKRMTESLRDLHDMATVPVVLIGMGDIDDKLSHRKQLTGRVMQNVCFQPLDLEDARAVAEALCEVKVRDDLLQRIHATARGAVRNIVVSLGNVERAAKARGMGEIGAAEWGKADNFFTGEAPVANVTPLRAAR